MRLENFLTPSIKINSKCPVVVQSLSHVQLFVTLWTSLSLRVCSNPCPLSWWCHPIICYRPKNTRPDITKLLEWNIGRTLFDINQSNIFLKSVSYSNKNKSKNKRDLIKLKSFCTARETIYTTYPWLNAIKLIILVICVLLYKLKETHCYHWFARYSKIFIFKSSKT